MLNIPNYGLLDLTKEDLKRRVKIVVSVRATELDGERWRDEMWQKTTLARLFITDLRKTFNQKKFMRMIGVQCCCSDAAPMRSITIITLKLRWRAPL